MTKREKIIRILKDFADDHGYCNVNYTADKILELDEGLSEGEILKVIETFWKNPKGCLCEYRELPDGYVVHFRKEDLAKALSGRIAKPE